jgi:hypothetical protein
VLARLDEIPGVSRSRADCSGHFFLVELVDGAADGIRAWALEPVTRRRVEAPDVARPPTATTSADLGRRHVTGG